MPTDVAAVLHDLLRASSGADAAAGGVSVVAAGPSTIVVDQATPLTRRPPEDGHPEGVDHPSVEVNGSATKADRLSVGRQRRNSIGSYVALADAARAAEAAGIATSAHPSPAQPNTPAGEGMSPSLSLSGQRGRRGQSKTKALPSRGSSAEPMSSEGGRFPAVRRSPRARRTLRLDGDSDPRRGSSPQLSPRRRKQPVPRQRRPVDGSDEHYDEGDAVVTARSQPSVVSTHSEAPTMASSASVDATLQAAETPMAAENPVLRTPVDQAGAGSGSEAQARAFDALAEDIEFKCTPPMAVQTDSAADPGVSGGKATGAGVSVSTPPEEALLEAELLIEDARLQAAAMRRRMDFGAPFDTPVRAQTVAPAVVHAAARAMEPLEATGSATSSTAAAPPAPATGYASGMKRPHGHRDGSASHPPAVTTGHSAKPLARAPIDGASKPSTRPGLTGTTATPRGAARSTAAPDGGMPTSTRAAGDARTPRTTRPASGANASTAPETLAPTPAPTAPPTARKPRPGAIIRSAAVHKPQSKANPTISNRSAGAGGAGGTVASHPRILPELSPPLVTWLHTVGCDSLVAVLPQAIDRALGSLLPGGVAPLDCEDIRGVPEDMLRPALLECTAGGIGVDATPAHVDSLFRALRSISAPSRTDGGALTRDGDHSPTPAAIPHEKVSASAQEAVPLQALGIDAGIDAASSTPVIPLADGNLEQMAHGLLMDAAILSTGSHALSAASTTGFSVPAAGLGADRAAASRTATRTARTSLSSMPGTALVETALQRAQHALEAAATHRHVGHGHGPDHGASLPTASTGGAPAANPSAGGGVSKADLLQTQATANGPVAPASAVKAVTSAKVKSSGSAGVKHGRTSSPSRAVTGRSIGSPAASVSIPSDIHAEFVLASPPSLSGARPAGTFRRQQTALPPGHGPAAAAPSSHTINLRSTAKALRTRDPELSDLDRLHDRVFKHRHPAAGRHGGTPPATSVAPDGEAALTPSALSPTISADSRQAGGVTQPWLPSMPPLVFPQHLMSGSVETQQSLGSGDGRAASTPAIDSLEPSLGTGTINDPDLDDVLTIAGLFHTSDVLRRHGISDMTTLRSAIADGSLASVLEIDTRDVSALCSLL